jgi:hypothetical protein
MRQGADGLEPHPLAKAIAPDAQTPPAGTSILWGFVGSSADPGVVRLWLDPAFSRYADVPTEAIRANRPADDGPTCLWIDSRAKLQFGTVQSHEVEAAFLSGAIAQAHMRAAARAPAAAWAVRGAPAIIVTDFPCPYSHVGCASKPIICGHSDVCPETSDCGSGVVCFESSHLFCPSGFGCPPQTLEDCPIHSFGVCPPPTFEMDCRG